MVEGYKFINRQIYIKNKFKKIVGNDYKAVLSKNKIFKDIHKNERCFIVGTGPSINNQDMTLLKGENCIFLSQFYFHDEYKNIQPKYHLISGIAIHSDISYKVGINWYRQIEKNISKDTILFINYLDRAFIVKNSLLKNHKVYYLAFQKLLHDISNFGIDMTKFLYSAQGIPIMAIQLSLYMGYKEIYLVGLDHCYDKKTGASHFYENGKSIVDVTALKKAEILVDGNYVEESYRSFVFLLDQHKIINNYAKNIGFKIFNATDGGVLEVYPRIKFNSLF